MHVDENHFSRLFAQNKLDEIFPAERADRFFDALFGDPAEGAYDINLVFKTFQDKKLHFDFQLRQRPGKCLACNLTYGLPAVFARHPILDISGTVRKIEGLLDGKARCGDWKLGATREIRRDLHALPLAIDLVNGPLPKHHQTRLPAGS